MQIEEVRHQYLGRQDKTHKRNGWMMISNAISNLIMPEAIFHTSQTLKPKFPTFPRP
jgi:hypothetical protein